jgi:hypothetical protein
MAFITVNVGATCHGGGHIELISYRDSVEIGREWRSLSEILPGGIPFKSVRAAIDYLIDDTSAPNLTAWKNIIKSKSVEVDDGLE